MFVPFCISFCMTFPFDLSNAQDLYTNGRNQRIDSLEPYGPQRGGYARVYEPPLSVTRGEELGHFELGSYVAPQLQTSPLIIVFPTSCLLLPLYLTLLAYVLDLQYCSHGI
jgi:hypothetical protein